MEHRRSGFTLIEIIAVLVMMSILSGIAYQQYSKVRIHAQAAALSYALHEMEDVMGQALIRGELYSNGQPMDDRQAIMRNLPEGDRAALDPELPDGLELIFLASGGRGGLTPGQAANVQGPGQMASTADAAMHPQILLTFMDNTPDNRHAALLDELARLRPTTAIEERHIIVAELFDQRDMVPVPRNNPPTSNP